jgi:hypothetical protein
VEPVVLPLGFVPSAVDRADEGTVEGFEVTPAVLNGAIEAPESFKDSTKLRALFALA